MCCLDSQVNIFSVREEGQEPDASTADDVSWRSVGRKSARMSHLNDLDEAAVWYERCLAVNSRNVACLCKYVTLKTSGLVVNPRNSSPNQIGSLAFSVLRGHGF